MFFDQLKSCELVRKNGKYSLGREDFDHLFGINDVMALTPNQENIAKLSDLTYLLGLLDINIKSFTAVAAGFLATYSSNDDYNKNYNGENYTSTFLISSNEEDIKKEIVKECRKKIKSNALNINNEIFYRIIELIEDGFSLSNVVFYTNLFIDTYGYVNIKDKHTKALAEFDRVNQQNCNDNHYILCKIIFNEEKLANELNEIKDLTNDKEISERIHEFAKNNNLSRYDEIMYSKRMLSGIKLYRKILHKFILPGYLTYRGRDRDNNIIPQDSMILNDSNRIKSLIDLLNNNGNSYEVLKSITLILNICSTDYTADMAYSYLTGISSFTEAKDNSEIQTLLDNTIPKTENNIQDKENTRKLFH